MKKKIPLDIQHQMAAMAANQCSISAIHKATGLHELTIKNRLKEPATIAMIEEATQLLAEKMVGRIEQILDSITPLDIEKASLQQKCTSAAILSDKVRQTYKMDKPAPLVGITSSALEDIDLSRYMNRG